MDLEPGAITTVIDVHARFSSRMHIADLEGNMFSPTGKTHIMRNVLLAIEDLGSSPNRQDRRRPSKV